MQEAAELHSEDLAAALGIGQEQAKPGFEVPGQGSHHHVCPVAEQVIDGHAHGVNSIFELLDDVLLIAAPVGKAYNLLAAVVVPVGDVKEVAHFIKENVFALSPADVFSQDDQSKWLFARVGLIWNLGDTLAGENFILVALEGNDALLYPLVRAAPG